VTYDLWTEAVDLPDFRSREEINFSNPNARLKKLTEGSEKESIEFKESGKQWKIESYGNKFYITRQMFVNDDLGVFFRAIQEFGNMAQRTANGLIYDCLQEKGDFAKQIIFSAKNGNLSSPGAGLNTQTLTAGRTAMRRQKAGDIALNINPKYLIVSPENETIAKQLLTSESDPSAKHSGVTNPFKNSLVPIVEAELDTNPWYLSASRKTIKRGYLQGTNRSPVIKVKQVGIGDVEVEGVFDFGVCVEDYRGLYKNDGAN
jgi:hypothetical protein